MIKRGVRVLLVVDADDHILGLVTSRDIDGEKPTGFSPRPAAAVRTCSSPMS